MKKLTLLLSLILSLNLIFAQTYKEGFKLYSTYTYDWIDSTGWINTIILNQKYDSLGNNIVKAEYNWNSTLNKWNGNYKNEYSYDTIGNQISYVNYKWNYYLSDWIKGSKYEYTYDIKGKTTLDIQYNWDLNINNWVEKYKYKYENGYDSIGNHTLRNSYIWWTGNNSWWQTNKLEFEYDSIGNKILYVNYQNGSLNDFSKKYEYTYDSIGNQISSIYYEWFSKWYKRAKAEFKYDSLGNKILFIDYTCDYGYSFFNENNMSKYSYDKNGNQILETRYIWSSNIYDWVLNSKYESSYDSIGNQILYVRYYWESTLNEWVKDAKYEYFYSEILLDTASFKTKAINNCEIEFSYEGTDFESVEVIYNNDTTVFTSNPFIVNTCSKSNNNISIILHKTNGQTKTFSYDADAILEVNELNAKIENISVYPNPTTKNINIELENSVYKVELLNQIGQVIYSSKEMRNKTNLDLSNYSKGLYFLKISTENKVYNRKIVLK